MRHTPTSHPQGVRVYHHVRDGMVEYADPWLVIDRVPSSIDGAQVWYMSCTFSDKGAAFGHGELTTNDVSRQGRAFSWKRIPVDVRRAIIADHPEWKGTALAL